MKRMSRQDFDQWQELKKWSEEFKEYILELKDYLWSKTSDGFAWFEQGKGWVVGRLYRQRGKYSGVFVHAGMVILLFWGLTLGPKILGEDDETTQVVRRSFGGSAQVNLTSEEGTGGMVGQVLGATVDVQAKTEESDKPRAEMIEYEVQGGDTLSTIAEKFGVTMDTIRWANNDKISSINSIKPGQELEIPPVTGIVHTVKSGETIYSVAKKYDTDPQSIVDFPFNTFINDETFALAIGQDLIVPDGVEPDKKPWSPTSSLARTLTPDAGSVSATGSWLWPAAGRISQPWRPWHRGLDIANKGGGAILAADSGTVVVAGWPDNWGYGNRVLIDHGNGYQTLYAHLSKVSVRSGQAVSQGDVLGMMGSTGRSTGIHLHFEIRAGGGGLNPLNYLK